MKKRLKPLLCLLLSVCLLAGCQQQNKHEKLLDPDEPVTLEIWHYYNGPQQLAFDELVQEFNETLGREQGIVVQAYNQGNVNDLIGKVLDAANKKPGASEIPDIFAAYADTAYQVDQLGLVASLDQYLTEEELAEYREEYIEEGRFDQEGNLKIFPTAKSTEILMLNKTDWEPFAQAAGVTADDLATFEGITAVAQKYYDWTDSQTPEPNDGKAFFGRDAMANYMLIGCRQLGVELLDVENGEITFNTDEKALRRLWDNYYIPYINGYFTAVGKFRSDDAKTGSLIALIGSTSGAAYFPTIVTTSDTESYPIESLSLPTPVFEGGVPFAVQQGAGMVVSKSNETTEYAATVFLKWFTDSQRNIEFSVGSGYLPVKAAANNLAMFQAAMESNPESMTPSLEEALPVALEIVQKNTLYTSKAFAGGTAARAVLENSMQDQAAQDAAAVRQALAAGKSREEATAPFTSDEHFQQWLETFRAALNDSIA